MQTSEPGRLQNSISPRPQNLALRYVNRPVTVFPLAGSEPSRQPQTIIPKWRVLPVPFPQVREGIAYSQEGVQHSAGCAKTRRVRRARPAALCTRSGTPQGRSAARIGVRNPPRGPYSTYANYGIQSRGRKHPFAAPFSYVDYLFAILAHQGSFAVRAVRHVSTALRSRSQLAGVPPAHTGTMAPEPGADSASRVRGDSSGIR